jgi:hypothetical protein
MATKTAINKRTNRDQGTEVRHALWCLIGICVAVLWTGLASISTVLEMTNGTADLGEADDKLFVAEPRHGCWGVGKF